MIPKEGNSASPSSSPGAGKGSKANKKNFMFINLSEQEVIKRPGEVNGNSFKLAFLVDCTAWLLDHTSSIRVDECENSRLYIGPVAGTAQLQDLEGCVISVACKQLKCVNCNK